MMSFVDAGVLPGITSIRQFIRSTSTYAHLSDADIRLTRVTFSDLEPLQVLLAQRKLQRAQIVIKEHARQRLPLFSPLAIGPDVATEFANVATPLPHNAASARISLPPIVEEHHGRFVIIDGHHRLFELYNTQRNDRTTTPIQVIAISHVDVDLPATPVKSMASWREKVRIDDVAYYASRASRYSHYDASCWRPIRILLANGAIVNRTRADE
ncbi:MAG TPA: hypothetical protein VMV29_20800 [Ktedonobacterales bacterium]|nr:hypothetical protein [Ktedonobacterales bacterium]